MLWKVPWRNIVWKFLVQRHALFWEVAINISKFIRYKKIIKFSGSRPSFQERNYRLIYFFFRSDVLFCFILFLLAISVGYMGNHCLTNAPKTSEDSDAQEATSLILTAVFVLGQASGSFFSLFVIRAIWIFLWHIVLKSMARHFKNE